MSRQNNDLQDLFLTALCRTHMPVTLFLMNGFQMRGRVAGFDSFLVVLMTEGRQQAIYKHAISTLVPEKPLELGEGVLREGTF